VPTQSKYQLSNKTARQYAQVSSAFEKHFAV
jgi:hypothetical protein